LPSVESWSFQVTTVRDEFRVMLTVSENEGVTFSGLNLKKTMMPRTRHRETTSREIFNAEVETTRSDNPKARYSLRKVTTGLIGYIHKQ